MINAVKQALEQAKITP
ncbi:hypothetical protein IMY97_23110 [Pectobacterium versatile]|nr:hypothetical protein [Pectobacterium versatile]UNE80606.1 hypothetical protein IMY97_23110 [Pectobacterium versatile]